MLMLHRMYSGNDHGMDSMNGFQIDAGTGYDLGTFHTTVLPLLMTLLFCLFCALIVAVVACVGGTILGKLVRTRSIKNSVDDPEYHNV